MKSPRTIPPSELHLYLSAKRGAKLDPRLGELLRSLALLNKLNDAIASVQAERAASGEVYPAYDVVVICKLSPPRFSSAQLADLSRIYSLASQYGCEPSDIKASERPSKPLRKRSKSRPISNEQRAAYAVQKKGKTQRERERVTLAQEAAWMRELATWPPFVPRQTVDALQVVTRDLSTYKTPAPMARPYIAKVDPRECQHVNKRSYTFSTGEVISLCPDCDKTSGTEVLRVPNILKPTEACMLFYGKLLANEGLSMYAGLNPMLSYCTSNKMGALEHETAFRERWGGVRVNLSNWASELDGEDQESPLNSRSDRSVRDYRAREMSRAQDDYVPALAESAHCKRCGQRFTAPRRGTKYCSDNCRKRHHEAKKERT